MRELIKKLIDCCKKENIESIECDLTGDNKTEQELFRKLGFRLEKKTNASYVFLLKR